jgi:hypothetical protein
MLVNKKNITIGNDLNVNKNRLIKPIVEMLYSIGKMKPPSDGIQGEYFNLVLKYDSYLSLDLSNERPAGGQKQTNGRDGGIS